MKLKTLLYTTYIFLLLLQIPSYSQFSLQLASEHEYNNNPFRSRIPERNFISAYDLTLQYEYKNLGVLYNGTSVSFSSSRDRNFFHHMGGIWAGFDSSAVSLSFEQRINNPLYSYFDYNQFDLNYEHHLTLWGVTAAIYPSVSYISYKNISILDNVKSSLTLSLNKSFETKTTMILGGAINHKIYTRPNIISLIKVANESGNITESLIDSQNATTLTQVTGFGRIAQSLFPTTGVAFQFTGKKIISGLASSVKDLSLYYGDESEIFDDPVIYEGTSFLFELTQIMFEDLEIKLGFYNNKKFYPSQGIYDSANFYYTDTEREDTQNLFSVSVKKPFSLTEKLALEVGLKYYFINNSSNSYWFQYKSGAFNVNLSLSF